MEKFFKRFEKKYIISATQYELLMYFTVDRLVEDRKTGYRIRNLYYDTDKYDLIRASIEKPVYKEKLRLRIYGTPKIDTQAYIELKKKVDGIVYKRRFKTELLEAIAFLGGGHVPSSQLEDRFVIKEIQHFLTANEVKPKAFISYDRQCMKSVEDPGFRMTFDSNLIFKNIDSGADSTSEITSSDMPMSVLEPEKMIMEIKTPSSIPLWLSKLMSELSIYPTSFSKYGTAYKTYVARNMFTCDQYKEIKEKEVILSA